MIARLSRIVPLLILLAVVAGVVYLVVAYRHSPNRAKEILIKLFTVLTGALSVFFLLVSAYAWFEHNDAVFDLAFSFLITVLIGLVVTRICRAIAAVAAADGARIVRLAGLRRGDARESESPPCAACARGTGIRWRATCELARTPTPTVCAGASPCSSRV